METASVPVQTAMPTLSAGRLVSSTLSVLKQRLGLFLSIVALPSIVVAVVQRWPLIALWLDPVGVSQSQMQSRILIANIVSYVLSLLFGLILQGAFGYAVYQLKIGKHVTLGECFAKGLRRLIPMVLTAVVAVIMIYGGFVLLIIPGILCTLALSIVMPACVVEKLGVVASIKRSFALTKDFWGTIFGAQFLLGLIIVVVVLITSLPIGIVLATGGLSVGTVAVLVTLSFLAGIISSMLFNAMSAVIYFELRTIKEGIVLESLINVFD